MDAKAYLNQAYYLDIKINADLDKMKSLRDVATNITVAYSDMPHAPSPNLERMASAVDKIVDLNNDIDAEIDSYVDLKREIKETINMVGEPISIILDLHYLNRETFESIACKLHYGTRWIHELHERGLDEVQKILDARG